MTIRLSRHAHQRMYERFGIDASHKAGQELTKLFAKGKAKVVDNQGPYVQRYRVTWRGEEVDIVLDKRAGIVITLMYPQRIQEVW